MGAKGFDGINELRTAYPGVSKPGIKCWKKLNADENAFAMAA